MRGLDHPDIESFLSAFRSLFLGVNLKSESNGCSLDTCSGVLISVNKFFFGDDFVLSINTTFYLRISGELVSVADLILPRFTSSTSSSLFS